MRICKSRRIVVVGDELGEVLEVWKKGKVDLKGNKGSCALALSQFLRQVDEREKCLISRVSLQIPMQHFLMGTFVG